MTQMKQPDRGEGWSEASIRRRPPPPPLPRRPRGHAQDEAHTHPEVHDAPTLPIRPTLPSRTAAQTRSNETQHSTASSTTSTPKILQSRPPGADYAFYESVPLEGHSLAIRLLTIAPGSGDDAMRCTLECTRLDRKPAYEALSYYWGPVDELKRIEVNGHALYITPNLRNALQHLRKRSKPRCMWIDAICINQDSNEERAQQVSIMSRIYQSASRTAAWLGMRAEDSERAFSMLRDQLIPAYDALANSQTDQEYERVRDRMSDKVEGKVCDAMVSLLMRPWFSRVWVCYSLLASTYSSLADAKAQVIQEVATSAKVILHCGSDKVSLVNFTQCFETFCTSGLNGLLAVNADKGMISKGSERAKAFGSLLDEASDSQQDGETESLAILASRFRHCEATRPEDKLFALYGLARDVEALGLRPDYNAKAEETYTNVAFAILQLLEDMSILEVSRGQSVMRRGGRLPSWVPDWSDTSRIGEGLSPVGQASRTTFLLETDDVDIDDFADDSASESSHSSTEQSESEPVQRFNASGGTALQSVSRDAANVLTLEGAIVDSIAEVSTVLTGLVAPGWAPTGQSPTLWQNFRSNGAEWSRFFIQQWSGPIASYDEIFKWDNILVQEDCHPHPDYYGEERAEAFVQTLSAGTMHIEDDHTLQSLVTCYSNFLDAWQRSVKWNKVGRILSLSFKQEQKQACGMMAQVAGTIFGSLESFKLVRTFAPTFGRRIARTKKGRFALVPAGTGVGDRIAILRGGNLPLVMRAREGKAMELVGESYVHGIMHGEAWDEGRCKDIRIV